MVDIDNSSNADVTDIKKADVNSHKDSVNVSKLGSYLGYGDSKKIMRINADKFEHVSDSLDFISNRISIEISEHLNKPNHKATRNLYKEPLPNIFKVLKMSRVFKNAGMHEKQYNSNNLPASLKFIMMKYHSEIKELIQNNKYNK
jgi:hypothetical protein